MKTYRYVVADVFTDTPLQGNQLAVFTDGRGLDDAEDAGARARDRLQRDGLRAPAGERRQRADPDLHAGLRAAVRRPPDARDGVRARRAAAARRDHARDRPRQRAREARAGRIGADRVRPDGAAGADDRAVSRNRRSLFDALWRRRLGAAGRALRQRRHASSSSRSAPRRRWRRCGRTGPRSTRSGSRA